MRAKARSLSRSEVANTRRVMNDSIANGAERLDHDGNGVDFEFFCECGNLRCDEKMRLTVAQYRCARFWPVVAHTSAAA